jgi:hypothetical protein
LIHLFIGDTCTIDLKISDSVFKITHLIFMYDFHFENIVLPTCLQSKDRQWYKCSELFDNFFLIYNVFKRAILKCLRLLFIVISSNHNPWYFIHSAAYHFFTIGISPWVYQLYCISLGYYVGLRWKKNCYNKKALPVGYHRWMYEFYCNITVTNKNHLISVSTCF